MARRAKACTGTHEGRQQSAEARHGERSLGEATRLRGLSTDFASEDWMDSGCVPYEPDNVAQACSPGSVSGFSDQCVLVLSAWLLSLLRGPQVNTH